jgi:hypothetical protein
VQRNKGQLVAGPYLLEPIAASVTVGVTVGVAVYIGVAVCFGVGSFRLNGSERLADLVTDLVALSFQIRFSSFVSIEIRIERRTVYQ